MNLVRLVDTSAINIKDSKISQELSADLRRMDRLKNEKMPLDSTAYTVKVIPSNRTYHVDLHRFIFEIQYGKINSNNF